MTIFWRVVAFAAVLLLFDTLFSWLSTCDPESYPNPANESYEKYCSAFKGPFVTVTRLVLIGTGHVLHNYGEGVIAAFTIILALSTIALWKSTEKLFQAGERQAQITREAIIADQRAWITTDLLIKGDFSVTEDSVAISVAVRVTNIGKTAALRAHTNLKMIFDYNTDVEVEVKNFCEINRRRDIAHGRLVLPNENYERPWHLGADRAEFESCILDFGKYFPDLEQHGKYLYPFIIGCVTYDLLHDNSIRQTAFVYNLFLDAPNWSPPLPIETGNIPSHLIRVAVGTGGFVT